MNADSGSPATMGSLSRVGVSRVRGRAPAMRCVLVVVFGARGSDLELWLASISELTPRCQLAALLLAARLSSIFYGSQIPKIQAHVQWRPSVHFRRSGANNSEQRCENSTALAPTRGFNLASYVLLFASI